ncbi:hypothetical protein QAD02_002881 [Eretmocerus hayati]|uniref:Uncharacterized protein n=1 Tax=Eretmocerus hayati TaxID=131215 RepID=A0ACC2NN15_9HYME|nr:hypothetical protein QAD02_002881 [Eretmocerus hayati]
MPIEVENLDTTSAVQEEPTTDVQEIARKRKLEVKPQSAEFKQPRLNPERKAETNRPTWGHLRRTQVEDSPRNSDSIPEYSLDEEEGSTELGEEVDTGDSADGLISEKAQNRGRKRKRFDLLHKRRMNKRRKDSGKSYLTHKNVRIPAKGFVEITMCCGQNCSEKFLAQPQKEFHEGFYALKDKEKQDNQIKSCLVKKPVKRRASNVKSHPRDCTWEIHITHGNYSETVYREFFLKVLNISEKRFRIVQDKMKAGKFDMVDLRGSHRSRPHKINEDIFELALKHLHKIPHRKSHYTNSDRKYSDDSSLTAKCIYKRFKIFYSEQMGCELRM